jgi:hypothetical protein
VTVTQAGAISVVTFDGKGHGTGSITYVLGATPYVNITINCVYSVATNGIGSYTCSSSISPDPFTYAFVLNSISGQRAGGFQFLLTDPLFSANFAQTGFAIRKGSQQDRADWMRRASRISTGERPVGRGVELCDEASLFRGEKGGAGYDMRGRLRH